MDVTIENFEDVLKEIEEKIPNCSFVSMDCEFTGLEKSPADKVKRLDRLEDRYQKVKTSAENFALIQFGLCLWMKEEKEGKIESFIAKPYNFYIFRRGKNAGCFTCQSNSMEFLINNEMDFNKVINQGITFCNKEEEEFIKNSELAKKTMVQEKMDLSSINEPTLQIVNQNKKIVKDWFENSSKEFLDLEPCNPYIRRILYQEIPEIVSSTKIKMTSEKDKKGNFIRVKRITGFTETVDEEVNKILDKEVGFSKIIKLFEKYQPIIIGHNFLLDMAHVFHKFLKPLPPTLKEFKKDILTSFPRIIDTKYITENYLPLKNYFSNTSLEEVFKTIRTHSDFENSIELNMEEDEYHSSDKFHQAGYDAYMTGFIFIKMSEFIGKERDKIFTDLTSIDHLKDFKNYMNVMQNDSYICLDEEENPIQDRSNVFYVTNFPSKNVKNDDIRKLFKKYGRIKIDWIDETSTFVTLDDKQKSIECLEDLASIDTYRVIPYDLHRNPIIPQSSSKKRKRMVEDKEEEQIFKKKKSESQCIIS
eukprot:gene8747-695_t